jgi:membrane protein required for beta-lactamase induction
VQESAIILFSLVFYYVLIGIPVAQILYVPEAFTYWSAANFGASNA